jgi:hypothetical protein
MNEIKTAEELNALPVKSVVVDADGDAWQKRDRYWPSEEDWVPAWRGYDNESADADDLLGYAPLLLALKADAEALRAPSTHDPDDCGTCGDHADATLQADRDEHALGADDAR